jgi:tRNA dimethylallyltransferase
MLMHKYIKPVIFIVGPTASGKTNLSIQLAKVLNTEIISADSRYFYRHMNIGTAKPVLSEMDGVIHHMIDIVEPDETLSVAVFKEMVEEKISTIHKSRQIPLIVGGTGQYIHSILKNWEMPEIEADYPLRKFLEDYAKEFGKQKLYSFLDKVDPVGAGLIDYHNVRRTIRAVEVMMKTGYKFSDQRKSNKSPYSMKIIGINWDRQELYKRIDQRIEVMLENGLIEEVKKLLTLGFTKELPSMSAIGYREIAAYINEEISLDEAKILMRRNSRTYVRRQANWFKENDPTIKWFDAKRLDVPNIIEYLHSDTGWLIPE